MKNYEKYAEKIKEYSGGNFCDDFVIPHIFKLEKGAYCCNMNCDACRMLQMLWLLEEYEEPETDWSKVEVDTPILVRTVEGAEWFKRHFAKYEDGRVFVWNNGKTSWTAPDDELMTDWNYAKLAEGEEE